MIVLRAWLTARPWRELAYLVTGVFLGVPTFALAVVGIVTTVASALTVGLPLLVGVLALARLTPRYFRGPARRLLGWDWADPPPLPAGSLWARARALPSDPAAWRALTYCLARWPLMIAGAYPGLFAVVATPVAVTYPLWWFLLPEGFRAFDNDRWTDTWPIAAQGLAVLLVAPWWLRLIVLLDRFLVRALLHPSRSQQRIAELEAGRTALRSDSAALLRRVERDLHDGTQARLVALGLTLSRIENHSTQDPVRKLAADARGAVTEALAELRDIVRGMHPPALDDGLEVALSTLAARSAVPAELTVSLTDRPPDATASALYFAVAELLTNIARHANATRAGIDLRTDGRRLRLTVTDNGHGGATIITPTTPTTPRPTPATRDLPRPDPASPRPDPADPSQPRSQPRPGPGDGLPQADRAARHRPRAGRSPAPPDRSPAPPDGSPAPPDGSPASPEAGVVRTSADATPRDSRSSGRASSPSADARTEPADDGPTGGRPSGGSGTGLAGLARRAAALDGSLTVDSPTGGPTTVTIILPGRV